jgi:PIN domain nuclease of toxin-antitoxin system
LAREIPKNYFDFLPIGLNHATGVEALPLHHRDPFDRLLIAQALGEKIPIVSGDAVFDAYGVTRLW